MAIQSVCVHLTWVTLWTLLCHTNALVLEYVEVAESQQHALRHGQHHLRHLDKYQLAWEPPQPAPQPPPDHQHKSPTNAIRRSPTVDDIDYHPAIGTTDSPNSYPQQQQQQQQLQLPHVAGEALSQQRLLRHRQQKQLRERQVLALKENKKRSFSWNDVANQQNNDADNNNNYSRNLIVGSLTAFKQKQLGTPEAVQMARREKEEAKAKARAHMEQVKRDFACHLPQKRCVSSGRDPSKIYTPPCTIVHRCAEDSGCCPSRTEVCAPKRTHIIEPYFYVTNHRGRQVRTERLTFVNHTECHCIERSNYHAEMMTSPNGEEVPRVSAMLNCNCPLHFERILQNDGQCRCDCSSNNVDCDYRKQGTEHFSLEDRKCIKEGRCRTPTCQYGDYMEKYGSCPKPHDLPSHQRSTYNAMGMS